MEVASTENCFFPSRTLQDKMAIRVLTERSEVEVLHIGCNILFHWGTSTARLRVASWGKAPQWNFTAPPRSKSNSMQVVEEDEWRRKHIEKCNYKIIVKPKVKAFEGCLRAHLLFHLYGGMSMFRITLGNVLAVCFLEKGIEELGKDGRKEGTSLWMACSGRGRRLRSPASAAAPSTGRKFDRLSGKELSVW